MFLQVILLGAIAGSGLLLAARGLFPPRATLDEELLSLGRPNWSSAVSTSESSDSVFGHRVIQALDLDLRKLEVDLRVVNRSNDRHVLERVKTAVALALAPLVFGLAMPYVLSGQALLPPLILWTAPVALGLVGWVLTDHHVRSQAARRRREFDAGLATYLGLVATLTAAGSGLEDAMWTSVDQGRGWTFQTIRRALSDARNRGASPWEVMDEYGRYLQLPALIELGATFQLSGTSGAHIRETVMTKARSLRDHQLVVIETEANANTTAMHGPIGFMLAGFVILLLFPAVTTVLSL